LGGEGKSGDSRLKMPPQISLQIDAGVESGTWSNAYPTQRWRGVAFWDVCVSLHHIGEHVDRLILSGTDRPCFGIVQWSVDQRGTQGRPMNKWAAVPRCVCDRIDTKTLIFENQSFDTLQSRGVL
jgi:hypothetical protein